MSESNSKNALINVNSPLIASELEKQAGLVAGKIFGRTSDAVMDISGNIIGGLIGDRIKEWRTRNLVKSLSRTADLLREKGIALDKAKSLPMGEAYSLFEEASKQDDPDIAEMWSAMLANAMNHKKNVKIETAFVTTLKNISGAEARILKFMFEYEAEKEKLNKEIENISQKFSRNTEENKKLSLTITELNSNFEAKINKLYSNYIKTEFNDNMEIYITNLMKEKCIYIQSPIEPTYSLTNREYIEGFRSVETLDNRKVGDAINGLRKAINAHNGLTKTKNLITIYSNSALFGTTVICNYKLTYYGRRLVEACEAK